MVRCFAGSVFLLAAIVMSGGAYAADRAEMAWPPKLSEAKNGTVTFEVASLLAIPESVVEASKKEGAAPFVVAKTPPVVNLAFHDNLGPNAATRRLWSSWGDIGLASDGSVYCAIGDHGNDVGGDARCFIYRWDPAKKTLNQIVDMNEVVAPREGQPAWSKVHACIDEGPDGNIYFSCTLNDGNRARLPTHKWNDKLPGGQLYQYDPATGKTIVFANLPPRRCTATSLLDKKRNIWWCNLEAGEGNALFGLDLATKQPLLQTPDGVVKFNRDFAMTAEDALIFNGDEGALMMLDPATKQVTKTKSAFVGSPGIRCSTRESKEGHIYGVTHGTTQLFRYAPASDALEMLGPCWLSGAYTTMCVLSPDERFVYFLPGSHGGAFRDGTPVVQYEIASKQRKVLAFLAPTVEKLYDYVPAGTYGMKISADGSTLYVNFNGHLGDRTRPEKVKPNGFGLTAFAAVTIPESER